MNLRSTISIYGGGPGSGCNPQAGDCGRKSAGKKDADVEVFYHGTVLPSAKQMLKEGLVPKPEKAFQTAGIDTSKKGYVYVTQDKKLAMLFANARQAYDAAKPGSYYKFYNPWNGAGGYTTMWKREDAQPAVKTGDVAAVVEVDIPKNVASELKSDPDFDGSGQDERAKIKEGIIPKEYISKVFVKGQKNSWKAMLPRQLAAQMSGIKLYLVYYGPMAALKKHLNAGAQN